MNRKALTITLLTLMVLGTSSAYAQTQGEQQGNAWLQLTTTVKVTVKKWWDYWTGDETEQQAGRKTAADPNAQPTQQSQGTSAPSAPTTTPSPVAGDILPSGPQQTPSPMKEPLFQERSQGASSQQMRAVRDGLKNKSVMGVKQVGRTGKSDLPVTKLGVPTINWTKLKATKKIPRLDIGTESLISAQDFSVDGLTWSLQKPSEMKPLPKPDPVPASQIRSVMFKPAQKILGPRGLQARTHPIPHQIDREKIRQMNFDYPPIAEYKPLPYKPLPEELLKMVAALILYFKGDSCHRIIGMFHQLAKSPKVETEARFHLGSCADQLQMHQVAFDNLMPLIAKEDREYAVEAMDILINGLQPIYEDDFYKAVKGTKKPQKLITEKNSNDFHYRMAKGAYRLKDYKTSISYATKVNEKSDFYDDVRFLSAMNNFAMGDKKGALGKLEALWKTIEGRKEGNTNIRALTAVNLARMYFAQKKYDKALDHYMQVPKNHGLWVQALIEQGWTQLALEDYSGAIGNMYSLHSPYFKAVYQPESFAVRTIGYLNICQYGDAYRTLSFLEKDYRDWMTRTDRYLQNKSQPLTVYNTVKKYISGNSTENIEGVPYQVWREMARRKEFLNAQAAINDKFDEAKRYNGVNEQIKETKAQIRRRSDQAKRRFDEWKVKIAQVKEKPDLAKYLDEWNASLRLERDLIVAMRFQLAILEQSRQGFLDFQRQSITKLNKETDKLALSAGGHLIKTAQNMKTEMNRLLENNEFLRYEVFAGSGENIRYQVAGGEVAAANRVPAHIKPTKMMNWSFDGEFWEDEIGSYRSSLQNNCPADARDQAQVEGN